MLTRYWVLLLISIRYELQIDLLRQIRVPLACDLRVADDAKKQNRDSRGHAPCWDCTALSHTQRHAHDQRLFGWTNCYTLQTTTVRLNVEENQLVNVFGKVGICLGSLKSA